MSGSSYEREYKHQLEDHGWTVFRSAGSFAIDLIALMRLPSGKIVEMLIEVKSFKGDVFTVRKTKRMLRQWRDMLKLAKKFTVFYSLRMKGQKTFRLVAPKNLLKPYHWSENP